MTTVATITAKNQLTIPKEISQYLAWQGVKKVLVSTQRGTLIIEPLSSQVDLLAGSLTAFAKGKTTDLKRIRQATREKVARQVAREGL